MISLLLDTSVIVAALWQGHPRHEDALPILQNEDDLVIRISTHAIAETYSTLTKLPIKPRIDVSEAERMITMGMLPLVRVVPLDLEDYLAAVASIARLNLSSGAIYDALHVRAAEKAGCDELMTLNGRDFRRMPPAAPTRLVVI